MPTKESTLKRSCVTVIRQRGGWAKSAPQGIHSAGMADLFGVYRRVALVIETKLPGREGTLTKLQAETLDQAKKAGAIARVVTTKQQMTDILDRIDRKLDKK